MTDAMSAERALTIYELLDQNGVRCWVMGGWGIDALLGRVTRVHKDLDLLVQICDLPRYSEIVQSHGFDRKLEWSESQPVEVGAVQFDSAFVDAHRDGREIDVHVIDLDHEGAVVQFHTDPWPLPVDTISGVGTIDTRAERFNSSIRRTLYTNPQLTTVNARQKRGARGCPTHAPLKIKGP